MYVRVKLIGNCKETTNKTLLTCSIPIISDTVQCIDTKLQTIQHDAAQQLSLLAHFWNLLDRFFGRCCCGVCVFFFFERTVSTGCTHLSMKLLLSPDRFFVHSRHQQQQQQHQYRLGTFFAQIYATSRCKPLPSAAFDADSAVKRRNIRHVLE